MPKDTWRTSSAAYRQKLRMAQKDKTLRKRNHKAKRKRSPKPLGFIITAGTAIFIRAHLGDPWQEAVAQEVIHCKDALWKHLDYYGFSYRGCELKVRVGSFGRG